MPDLTCHLLFSSELFLMTQHLRDGGSAVFNPNLSPSKPRFSSGLEIDRNEECLRNNKIEKLLSQLSDDTEGDYEMDCELRSSNVTNRFNKKSHDAFDLHLDNFLQEPKKPVSSQFDNENKENLSSVVKPSKRKLVDSAPKTLLRKRRTTPPLPKSSMANGILPASLVGNTAIPVLRTTASSKVLETSPQRICVPRSVNLPKQPAIKFQKNNSIFLVDSLTGSVSDATQFGTELNSSNCEGFPLPDDINEVVQIPTNATGSAVPKMAIIRAIYSKRLWNKKLMEAGKIGFYSKREFEEVKLHEKAQMTVYNDEKKVRWSEDLEW
ncbi:hypothetical protein METBISCDRAFT_24295 [Metschnikowia bicuspidata]|uniref:Uncharacterized protein n=1 Tax=Metschnikowia bicuspidata TaxID=27322 RepID=A0A4P9Z9I6_9ASCO|nr:hypothetical protein METBISCDRAFT_24295 [Metschnikowia bicuspidata]